MATRAWLAAGQSGLVRFDRAGMVMADGWRSPLLDLLFSSLTWCGSLMLLLPLAAVACGLLWYREHRDEAQFLMTAVVGAVPLGELAKHLLQRPRPDLFAALVPIAPSWSLPSGHALQATAMALALTLVGLRLGPGCGSWAVPLALAVVLLVGLSRIYLQVHFPSDVLAGFVVGGCWVAGLRALWPLMDRSVRQA